MGPLVGLICVWSIVLAAVALMVYLLASRDLRATVPYGVRMFFVLACGAFVSMVWDVGAKSPPAHHPYLQPHYPLPEEGSRVVTSGHSAWQVAGVLVINPGEMPGNGVEAVYYNGLSALGQRFDLMSGTQLRSVWILGSRPSPTTPQQPPSTIWSLEWKSGYRGTLSSSLERSGAGNKAGYTTTRLYKPRAKS